MTKYDKELDTRTPEYEKAIQPEPGKEEPEVRREEDAKEPQRGERDE